ncbi:unnamed protein product [Fraxinus pennsylvanica]|uniref:DUF7356 domain-containing protein n=1 Tax=Fraxinus pennsylvanica TaxID=56036 RepID=A0AAD1ZEF2_9LAMI|nr:unnamed protein product [Fraxinus pennsylvanica]
MNRWTSILLIFFLISLVPCQSNASFLVLFRKLIQVNHKSQSQPIKSDQMSPSPSPVPSANSNTRDAQNPVNQPKSEICDMVSNKCDIAGYKITACVPSLGKGSGGSYMLILNDFESSLRLNIAVRPMNEILENIEIPDHQVKKVNLPSNTEGISSILLSTGNGNCVIHVGDAGSEGFYTTYFTPVSGTYLLFATGLLIAGIWACCKLGKRGRHLDGVPYRELEMGQKDSKSSSSVGTAEHWDQSWDEDRDEEKAMKSPRGSHVGKRLRNGSTLRINDNSLQCPKTTDRLSE